jgi:dolichyl-phosphate-mannose--protein O-mannosyl transferase
MRSCAYTVRPARRMTAAGPLLTRPQPFSVLSLLDEYEFIWAPLIFTFFAFFTRMYKIGLSPIVTWDEAQ